MKLATALRLGRVSNLPTVWTNVAAGLALAGIGFDPALAAGLCLAISSLYTGGMYLNDAFDHEYDARMRAERPIPRGEVSARSVFAAGFAMLAFGVAVVAAFALRPGGRGSPPVLAALALAAVILVYDVHHKQNPASPLVMAVNRVLVYVVAALSVRAVPARELLPACAVLFCYLVGLTYAAKQENLRAPRHMWPLLLLEVPLVLYALSSPSALRLGAWALLAGFTGYSLVFLLDARRRDIKRAVGYLIAGISLVDAMIVAGQGYAFGAAACAAGFAATLLAQRVIAGT